MAGTTQDDLTRQVEHARDMMGRSFVEQYVIRDDLEFACEYCEVGIMPSGDEWVTLDEAPECDSAPRGVHAPADDLDDDARQAFDESLLEAYAEARLYANGNAPTVQRVTLLWTFGGPNIFVHVDGDAVKVRGYWGGDEVVREGRASADVQAWCADLAEAALEGVTR